MLQWSAAWHPALRSSYGNVTWMKQGWSHFEHQHVQDLFVGGGFKDFLFLPLLGEMIQFDFLGWVETTN